MPLNRQSKMSTTPIMPKRSYAHFEGIWPAPLKTIRRYGPLIILLCLTIYGGCLRFHHLGRQSFWMDEAFSVAHAKAIVSHGYPRLDDGNVSWQYTPAHYLMAAGLCLFKDQHVGVRCFPALAGMLMILAVYGLSRTVYGSRPQALMAAAMVAFSVMEIAWSRQARSYMLSQVFMAASLAAYGMYLKKRRLGAAFWAALSAVASGMAHPFGYGLALFYAIALGWDWIRPEPGTASRRWRPTGINIGMVIAVLAILPVLVLLTGGHDFANVLDNLHNVGVTWYAGLYAGFLWRSFGWLLGWTALGAAWTLATRPRFAVPVLSMLAAHAAFICLGSRLYHERYILPLVPFVLMFAAAGLLWAWRLCGRTPRCWSIPTRAAVIGLFALSISAGVFTTHLNDNYTLGITAPQPDWRAAYAWIARTAEETDRPATNADTISTFPVFHDLYMPPRFGMKFFLPFSFSGYPGSFQETPPYSTATTIASLEHLRQVRGHIVLDFFGLRMLKDAALRKILLQRMPTHIVEGRFPVYIWRWDPAEDTAHRK